MPSMPSWADAPAAPPPPPVAPLPVVAGWGVARAPDGMPYWYNAATWETSWVPPAEPASAARAAGAVAVPFPQLPREGAGRVVFGGAAEAFRELSNVAEGFAVAVNGVEWPSAEHFFQAQKFPHLPTVAEVIRTGIASPLSVLSFARELDALKRPDWEAVEMQVMEAALRAKFSQHESLARLLVYTHPHQLVESGPPLARACPALALPPGVLPTPQPLFFACAPVPLAPLPPGVLPPPYAHPALAPGPAAAPAARKRAPVPVSTESVGSSTWRRVLCDTGHCYFYDTQTGRVAWALPPGVDYGAAAAETPLQPAQTPARGDGDSDGPGAAAEKRAREGAEGDEEEPAAKARRVEEEARQREEAEQEHQRCVETFKEMLREVGVAPFSQWDKELPKFVFDKRCSVLPPSERRAVFESGTRRCCGRSSRSWGRG
eukprot:m51a1_g13207 putative swarming motility protein ybia (432) ;mRNA; f:14-2570